MRFFGWYIGEWSECSTTCGASYRERTVKCTRNDVTENDLYHYNEEDLIQLDNGNVTWYVLITRDDFCGRDKPIDKDRCDVPLCTPEWVPQEWTQVGADDRCGT